MDDVLKRAIEKRDAAFREAERWESWIKTYEELSEQRERPQLQVVQAATGRMGAPTDELDIPSSLRGSGSSSPNVKG